MKKPQKVCTGGADGMYRGGCKVLGTGVEPIDKFVVVASVVQSMPLRRVGNFVDLKAGSVWVDDEQTYLEDGDSGT